MRRKAAATLALSDMILDDIADHFARACARAKHSAMPYDYWLFDDILPNATHLALTALTPAPAVAVKTAGRRETNNATRCFLDEATQRACPEAAALAGFLHSPRAIKMWRDLTGADLSGTFLRIEYCQDVAGFWLEPHTDIGAKKFTLLIYLADPSPGECWGTDILNTDKTLHLRASGAANSGVLFIPGDNSWHGFAPRPISGVRRTLIVNYVVPEWRARHELCAMAPVGV
jgi:hypothetical protein